MPAQRYHRREGRAVQRCARAFVERQERAPQFLAACASRQRASIFAVPGCRSSNSSGREVAATMFQEVIWRTEMLFDLRC